MLKSYLKVALRTLRKQKVVSAVTIGSLAVGLACCLLLFLYVKREWTYDRFHEGADRIFRVVTAREGPEGVSRGSLSPAPLAVALEEIFPEAEQTVRLQGGTVTVRADERELEEQRAVYADSSLFDVFTIPLAQGNQKTALSGPNSIVLSSEAAWRYFGTQTPVGRRLTVTIDDEERELRVTGVAEPLPAASSIQFDVLLPFVNTKYQFSEGPFRQAALTTWKMGLYNTYVRLPEGAEAGALEAKLPDFVQQHYGDEAGSVLLQLQPLADVHLDPEVSSGLTPATDPLYSYILGGIALLVLGLACINFTTLSLARSAGRAREVGIRKTVGAQREQVAAQFWGEAVLTTLCALVLGAGLARLGLPVFNRLANVELGLDLGSPSLWLMLVGLMLVVGLAAGAYPALALSGFAPASVLRGNQNGPGGRSRLTRVLVVLQFALATGLVAGVFIMQNQFDYISDKNLGFDEERVVLLNMEGSSSEGQAIYEPFKNALAGHSAVAQVTGGLAVLGGGMSLSLQVGDTSAVKGYVTPVAKNFAETLGIEVMSGRELSQTERDGVVLVNEELVRRLGWDDPIGKELPFAEQSSSVGKMMASGTVIGVFSDYHFQSLRESISPLVLAPRARLGGGVNQIAVRIRAGAVPQALDVMERTWQQVAPDRPFEYTFLADNLAQQYETEQRWRSIAGYAAGLALLISCAGLFGLALLTVQRRKKEIGIRKVMGASAWNVTALVARQFAWLVAVGFALAVPLAWLGARRWLQTFAYRIEVGPAPFLAAGAAVLVVAMVTVGYQALRAARANPVDAIRQE